jgi:hypothetical protein
MEGLRRQNSAYRALCASLEAQQAIHTTEGRKYHEAVSTLESERQANAVLTEENARLSKERDMAVEALRPFASALDEWGEDKGQPDRWDVYEHPIAQCVKLGAFRCARATLAQLEASKGEG